MNVSKLVFIYFYRVLVISEGRVAEFDSPSALIKDNSSIFHGMAKDAGLT